MRLSLFCECLLLSGPIKKAVVPKSTTAIFLCRRPESNRYGRLGPQDFKSCASASSATPATTEYNACALHNIRIIQNHI